MLRYISFLVFANFVLLFLCFSFIGVEWFFTVFDGVWGGECLSIVGLVCFIRLIEFFRVFSRVKLFSWWCRIMIKYY